MVVVAAVAVDFQLQLILNSFSCFSGPGNSTNSILQLEHTSRYQKNQAATLE